jgi:hypothetical protein
MLRHPGERGTRPGGPPFPQPFARLIGEQKRELALLSAYSLERLARVFRGVGFRCDRCARCCTRSFNGHVLLLDDDVEQVGAIDRMSMEPVPSYDFSDQEGTFYTSGYTIRAIPDREGSCWFLEGGLCRIYEKRPMVCRVYPYMLHREPDERGKVDWRQISGLDLHGEYHSPLSLEESLDLAALTKAFEVRALLHEIAFLECTGMHFLVNGLRYARKARDDRLHRLRRGEDAVVMVYHRGRFEPWHVGEGGRATRPFV